MTQQIEATRPLDFENPSDANGDNQYGVFVGIAEPLSFPRTFRQLSVTVTDDVESTTTPEFFGLPSNGQVSLVERNSQVVDLDAADADGQAVFFELVGEESNRLFDIDPLSGNVSWQQPTASAGFPLVFRRFPEVLNSKPIVPTSMNLLLEQPTERTSLIPRSQ